MASTTREGEEGERATPCTTQALALSIDTSPTTPLRRASKALRRVFSEHTRQHVLLRSYTVDGGRKAVEAAVRGRIEAVNGAARYLLRPTEDGFCFGILDIHATTAPHGLVRARVDDDGTMTVTGEVVIARPGLSTAKSVLATGCAAYVLVGLWWPALFCVMFLVAVFVRRRSTPPPLNEMLNEVLGQLDIAVRPLQRAALPGAPFR
ncbi:MAG: hypothetical protein JKY37_18510 [Nannocystaceae bacterium]|nr:hypothetical protein [Nannocystaceae bacterium]